MGRRQQCLKKYTSNKTKPTDCFKIFSSRNWKIIEMEIEIDGNSQGKKKNRKKKQRKTPAAHSIGQASRTSMKDIDEGRRTHTMRMRPRVKRNVWTLKMWKQSKQSYNTSTININSSTNDNINNSTRRPETSAKRTTARNRKMRPHAHQYTKSLVYRGWEHHMTGPGAVRYHLREWDPTSFLHHHHHHHYHRNRDRDIFVVVLTTSDNFSYPLV